MLTGDDPHLTSLSAADSASPEHELAVRYAPFLRFDQREPFLPLTAGYTVIRSSGPSPSFPRTIEVDLGEQVVEYAIWWDWDIVHLYELEHVWVYLDSSGKLARAEASWHGSYHSMEVNGGLPLSGDRLMLYSEPGKHAFAPSSTWFQSGEKMNRWLCCKGAGIGGVLVGELFTDLIDTKSPETDKLVQNFLRRHAFVPSYEFNRKLQIPAERLVPWPELFRWIPERVSYRVKGLQESVRSNADPIEPLECEGVP
jgi:putative hydrolase of the HAD superfamily